MDSLKALFPDYDDLILQSVLDSAGGDQDRAIDTLLTMNDPDYRPTHPPQSQEDLDEQFARQLVLQEQQQQEQRWSQAQPRPRAPVSPQQQPDGPIMADFQEQFSKIAETGKKTFGSIFSKVKAKIQELDTPSSSSVSRTLQQPQQWQAQQQPQQQWSPPVTQTQQPAYFDPNPASVSPSPPVQGYDLSTPLQPEPQPQPLPSPAAAAAATATVTPPPSTTSQGPLPVTATATTTPPAINAGKLGLLPKRPVSLLRDPPPASPPHSALNNHPHYEDEEDDDDGLEYAENPFEPGKK